MPSPVADLGSAGADHRVAQEREGEFLHHDVGDVGAGNVYPLPETLQAKEDRAGAGPDLIQQRPAAAGLSLAANGDRMLPQDRLQGAEDLHHPVTGREEGQAVAAGEAEEPPQLLGHLVHEVLDLAGAGIGPHIAGDGKERPTVIQLRRQGHGVLRPHPSLQPQPVEDEAEAGLAGGAQGGRGQDQGAAGPVQPLFEMRPHPHQGPLDRPAVGAGVLLFVLSLLRRDGPFHLDPVDADPPVVADAQDASQEVGLLGQFVGQEAEFVLGLLLEGRQGVGLQPGPQLVDRLGRLSQRCGQPPPCLLDGPPTAGVSPAGVRL